MEKHYIIALLIVGAALLVVAVYVRVRFGEKYELKTLDLALIILPLLFVAIISGKIKVLDAFGVKADFSDLFAKAASQNIDQQVTGVSSPGVEEVVDMLQIASKVGVRRIPDLIKNKTQGLVFRLGHGGYYGPAIEQYYKALYASSYLQYFIINEPNGQLFGVLNVLDLAVNFRTNGETAYKNFAGWLNNPTEQSKKALRQLPGFVGVEDAARMQTSKLTVLQHMDDLQVDRLPVVNEGKVFVGTLERSQLTSSVLLELAKKID